MLLPQSLRATGFEEPSRWLRYYSDQPPVLAAPEFYFELELKRIAADLKPEFRRLPQDGKESEQADFADFHAALEKNTISPPDAAAAERAHAEMRARVNSVTPSTDVPEPMDAVADPAQKPEPAKADVPLPVEFASEFADYHRGARVFNLGKFDEAKKAWETLLARPARERHYRTVWAMYMLGKTANETENWDEARAWFAKTRQAAREGFADSQGLAASSLGWEAYASLHGGKLPEAAHLYLEQLASGDAGAVISMKTVMGEMLKDDTDLVSITKDPLLQRLVTACAVAGMGPFFGEDYGPSDEKTLGMRWLKALERAGMKQVRDADRVAWIAYSRGQYAIAERWLARADRTSPYALWLEAKLALRAGKTDAAAAVLAKAVHALPETPPLKSRATSITDLPPEQAAQGDLGALRLGRGEFLAALKLFVEAGNLADAQYLAECVLTIDELKNVLTQLPKKPADAGATPSDADSESGWHGSKDDPTLLFKSVLGRRLVRAGRYGEARPHFDETEQATLDEYVKLLDAAKRRGASKAQQAGALWNAAELIVEKGDELFNYFDPVTTAQRLSGRVVETEDFPVIALKYGKPETLVPPVNTTERGRLKKNVPGSVRRFNKYYAAADLGWRAALLMPDNDEATAKTLNTAGSWLKVRDDDAADRFYQAIERRCPKTTLGKEAIKRHWFVPFDQGEN